MIPLKLMQKANNLFIGILLGMILPALAWFAVADWTNTIPYLSKPGVSYLIAIALNLILLRVCYRKGADQTGTGIMLFTFIFMLAAFILKIKH